MIEIKGKHCKDIKIFTENIEDSALSLIYELSNSSMFKDAKIRIMPDVHLGVGIVIGFTCPIPKENAKSTVKCQIRPLRKTTIIASVCHLGMTVRLAL